ncbi:hypothetical protein MUO32_26570 [Shinella sp. CPCC 101442]|uniref:hypothetical protein n=1 Tax=Shinella sp. CPCC 101442 TaxID=2932265 RepID=UPI0021524E0C|nr:hypothetical protein [Shinella sp. CPCC 101442]MCR6502596.1 hypothetical protein [Shinella sp. CPCC 101442]
MKAGFAEKWSPTRLSVAAVLFLWDYVMISAVAVVLLFGLGIPAFLIFNWGLGADSESAIVRAIVSMPGGAFVSGFIGFIIAALTETKDAMGEVVGDPWMVWGVITALGTMLFAVGGYVQGQNKAHERASLLVRPEAEIDPEEAEIERIKWEISMGRR